MGRGASEHLNGALVSHLNSIHENFQILDQAPAFTLEKVEWKEVLEMGEQVSKQATIAGLLFTGDAPKSRELEENMKVYFNLLQGFLLLSHGSQVGAGPTLSSSIHASVKPVVDCSFSFWKEAVTSFGSRHTDRKLSIPQLAGAVWQACDSLKKAPTTNYTAVGRAITKVAVSVKDVLRELKELKLEESSDQPPHNDDNSSEGDFGNDLSPDEMRIAQSAIDVVSSTLVIIRELIRFITCLLKQKNPDNSTQYVDSLEKLLKQCQGIGVQVDELGACLYPPQEVLAIKAAGAKICSEVHEVQAEVRSLDGSSESLFRGCETLDYSLKTLLSELGSSDDNDLVPELQSLAVS
ncbi:hypothetical protein GIB67_028471 [Kingdonia uniflora]|uniref:Uncharacterized protein n=1 Tax=Kingdonia uniflora TaxID=39325 RepID=A0A7J7P1I2_9MAGN|nr:hypothetical protein GIB67_028471 [Kingdonia uniflora]